MASNGNYGRGGFGRGGHNRGYNNPYNRNRFNPRHDMGAPFNQYYGANQYGHLMTPQSQGYYMPPSGFPPQGPPPEFPPTHLNTQNPAGHHTAPHPTNTKTPAKQDVDDPAKALFHTEEKGVSWRSDDKLTEEKPIDNDSSQTASPTRSKKKKKRNKERKLKMETVVEEKQDEEEGELNERETTDKRTKYAKNAHNQTKVKVSAPMNIQKKVIASVKEKIERKENISWEDFAPIQGSKDQLSTLIGLVLHKTITYQVNFVQPYPDRIFDYLKYTNKTSLLKALNDESYFYKVVERAVAHNPSSISTSMPELFPQLIGNELTSMIAKENPDAEMVAKGAQLYLHRVYIAEPDKVDDYIESTPIEEIVKLAKAPGKLAAAFNKHTGESYSLPYSLDLDQFPSLEWRFEQQVEVENNPKLTAENENPKPKGYGSGNWWSNTLYDFRSTIKIKQSSPDYRTGKSSNPGYIFQSVIGAFLGAIEEKRHFMEIAPFQDDSQLDNITQETGISKLGMEHLGNYFGNVVNGEKGWISFDFFYTTSLKAPCLLSSGSEPTVLREVLTNHDISLIQGDRWSKKSRPLWMLRYSLPEDDPTAITTELISRLRNQGHSIDDDLFTVEWHQSDKWLLTQESIEGWCVCGELRKESKIYELFNTLREISPAKAPVTHTFKPYFMYSPARLGNPLTEIMSGLRMHGTWFDKIISAIVEGVPIGTLDSIGEDGETLREKIEDQGFNLGDGATIIVRLLELGNTIFIATLDEHVVELQELSKAIEEMVKSNWKLTVKPLMSLVSKQMIASSSSPNKTPTVHATPTAMAPGFIPPPEPQQSVNQEVTGQSDKSNLVDIKEQLKAMDAVQNGVLATMKKLTEEVEQLKGSLPTVSVQEQTQSSSISSLTSLMGNVANHLERLQHNTPSITLEELRNELKQFSRSEIDNMFYRTQLTIPSSNGDSDVRITLSDSKDKIAPHTHSKEQEDRLANLNIDDLKLLVSRAPGYIYHDTRKECFHCGEGEEIGPVSYCSTCNIAYHEDVCMKFCPYGNNHILCDMCVDERTTEIALELMSTCEICNAWKEEKLVEIGNLAKEERISERTRMMILAKSSFFGLRARDLLNATEAALAADRERPQDQTDETMDNNNPDPIDFTSAALSAIKKSPTTSVFPVPNQNAVIKQARMQEATAQHQSSANSDSSMDTSINQGYKDDMLKYYTATFVEGLGDAAFQVSSDVVVQRMKAFNRAVKMVGAELLSSYSSNANDTEDDTVDDDGPPSEEDINLLSQITQCHPLFFSIETDDEETSYCYLATLQRKRLQASNLSSLIGHLGCRSGRRMETKEFIAHIKQHKGWPAQVIGKMLELYQTQIQSIRKPKASTKHKEPENSNDTTDPLLFEDSETEDSKPKASIRKPKASTKRKEPEKSNDTTDPLSLEDSESEDSAAKRFRSRKSLRLSPPKKAATKPRTRSDRQKQKERLLALKDDGKTEMTQETDEDESDDNPAAN